MKQIMTHLFAAVLGWLVGTFLFLTWLLYSDPQYMTRIGY